MPTHSEQECLLLLFISVRAPSDSFFFPFCMRLQKSVVFETRSGIEAATFYCEVIENFDSVA